MKSFPVILSALVLSALIGSGTWLAFQQSHSHAGGYQLSPDQETGFAAWATPSAPAHLVKGYNFTPLALASIPSGWAIETDERNLLYMRALDPTSGSPIPGVPALPYGSNILTATPDSFYGACTPDQPSANRTIEMVEVASVGSSLERRLEIDLVLAPSAEAARWLMQQEYAVSTRRPAARVSSDPNAVPPIQITDGGPVGEVCMHKRGAIYGDTVRCLIFVRRNLLVSVNDTSCNQEGDRMRGGMDIWAIASEIDAQIAALPAATQAEIDAARPVLAPLSIQYPTLYAQSYPEIPDLGRHVTPIAHSAVDPNGEQIHLHLFLAGDMTTDNPANPSTIRCGAVLGTHKVELVAINDSLLWSTQTATITVHDDN